MKKHVVSMGVQTPVIGRSDNLMKIVSDSVLKVCTVNVRLVEEVDQSTGKTVNRKKTIYDIGDNDVIGISSSAVSAVFGQYATSDDIAKDIEGKFGKNSVICVACPIYSEDRFSPILRGVARAAGKIMLVMPEHDETGAHIGSDLSMDNIGGVYKSICESENCECTINEDISGGKYPLLDCRIHPKKNETPKNITYFTLDEICTDKSPDWGLLGARRIDDETMLLFPSVKTSHKLCNIIKKDIRRVTKKNVIVCVYADGCFKNPVDYVWDFTDPVTMPAYTDWELIESRCATDGGRSNKIYRDVIASLMNLTAMNGDTDIVLVKNYFA